MKDELARQRRAAVEEIEPRILYSADFAPALSDAPDFASEAEQRIVEPSGEFAQTTFEEVRVHEIVFVDSATPDYAKLIDDLRAQEGEREIEVVLIEAGKDGISDITKILTGRQGISALHIVSHGSDGSVQLGESQLNFDSLLKHASKIKGWGSALTSDADILIYGCDVAASQDGKSLIQALARLTGADVAASDDLTGSARLGGDWNLEFHTGQIDSSVVFSQSMVLDWSATLQGVTVGGETRANSTTSGVQDTNTVAPPRVVAMDANGNYVVAWSGEGTGDTTGVFFQRYNANGVAQGGETRVNTAVTADTQDSPSVAMDASGNFVIAWRSNNEDGSGTGIYAKRYNATGVVQGSQFRVNTTTANDQANPVVAMNASGAFVVAWVSHWQDGDAAGVYAQRYNASGVAQGGEFAVTTTTTGDQWVDSVAMDAAGNFVVTFSSADTDASGIWMRRFNASGTALGGEVRVNNNATGDQGWSSIAMAPDGDYVIAWKSDGTDGSLGGIYARRYDSAGVAQGNAFRVNTTTANDQQHPAVAMDTNGNFMVVWASLAQDGGGWGIYRQEYNADGTANGGEVRVNTTTANDQMRPALVMNAVGQTVVAWAGNGTGDGSGVFFQRYSTALVVDTASDYTSGSADWGDPSSISALLANKGADGKISLREAITAANNTANANANSPDRIYFSIPGGGVRTINLASQLPFITGSVIIDGTTQTGYAGMPLVEVDGQGTIFEGLYLDAGSDGSTIEGLILNRFRWAIDIDGSSNNVVTGNFLGTDATGTVAKGNWVGVWVGTSNNTIGGTTAADRNIISGNTVDGIQISGSAGGTGNVVLGNYIGLDVTGTADLGNTNQGIALFNGAKNNIIGGTEAGARNVISGNNGEGVRLINSGTTGNIVLGNFIGTNAAGTAAIANTRHGVWIEDAAANNTIGGTATDAGNTIAYNTLDGVSLSGTAGSGNSVLSNAIFSNVGLGIDLGDNGVTDNNGAKTAGQPNLLMDFPVIQLATLNGTTLTLAGYIGTAAGDTDFAGARLEFFETGDPASANGEGQIYLGFLTADASGNYSGTLTVSGLALGDRISATATDGSNNTSEFGLNVAVTVTAAAPVATNDAYSLNEDGTLTVPAASDWWNTSWTQRRQLTFNNTGQAENLSNFAVLVKLDNTHVNYALTQNAGQDLRFVDANGTVLAHEIERWNESGTSYVWVSVPQIDASSATDYIWMYCGNAAAADGQNAEAVWDAGFRGVWHLHSNELDSAGTNEGTNSGSTNTAGIIGDGQSFDGVNDQVYTSTSFTNPQQYTIEAWFRTTSASGRKIIGFENQQTGTGSTQWDRELYIGTDGRLYFGSFHAPTTSEDVANSTATYTDGAWHYAVGVRNNFSDTLSLYVDGVLVDTSSNLSSENYTGYWRLGGYKQGAGWPAGGSEGYYNGSIDEARVSTQARSADWIRAQYLSMSDSFVGFGAAQGMGVLVNDTDPNGDALTAVLVGGPSNASSFALNANGSFTYTPTANFSGTDTFTYRAYDGANNSNIATVTITVNPVNDAPLHTVPGAQATNEDTALVFSSGNGNRISIADVDAASGPMRVTLTATNGSLTLAGLTGLTFTTGDGTADATMTFTGTVANINTALNGLAFAPTANFAGTASVAISTSDQGNTGSGGALSDSDSVAITVNTVNDAPTATITPATYAATEQSTLTLHATGLAIGDVDAAANVMATVSVTSGMLSASAGSTGVSVAGSGTASVTLTGTVTQINNLLAGLSSGTLTYLNNADAPAATATLTLSVNDNGNSGSGGALTGSDTATINIAAVNDLPTAIIVPPTYSATEQTTLALHGTGMSVTDPDAGASSITVTVAVTAGTLAAGAGTNSVAISGSGTGTLTLTGALAEINNVLAGANGGTLAYVNNSDAPGASATLTLSVDDGGNTGSGGALIASDTATINISAVNDAPVNTVPGAQSTNEDNARVFSSANGNQISIADPDAGPSTLQVTLTATNGIVTLAGTTGLTITAGANGSATVTFRGSAANINSALDGLAYTPTANYNGAASLQIATSDLGNNGSGGALTDTDTVSISVNPIDDPIGAVSDTNGAANSIAENAAVGALAGITASATDPDTTDTVTYSLDDDAGGAFTIDSATGIVSVIGAIDRELGASRSITVRAMSSGGGSSIQAFTINVTDVDEFDVAAINDNNGAPDSVAENAGIGTLVGITAAATDADATNNTVTYSLDDSASGRFAINASTGVVTVAGALDRESAASHTIVVRATSSDGSSFTQGFTVGLTDVDEFDVAAISDTDGVANTVAEDTGIGSVVHITAFATDADATTNTTTYSLLDDAGALFAINATNGVVTLAGALNYENVTSHSIVVQASSADGSSITQTFAINVTDVDEFDVGAISDNDGAADSVAENAGIGSVVGITAFATDADGTTNTITYSLANDASGRFDINTSTGVVTVAGALDYESAPSHGIVVRATSADGSSITQAFTIAVTNVNEFGVGAISDTDLATNSVAEDAIAGTVVGITARAVDPDNTVTYSLIDDAGARFTIDSSTGVVTVAGALNRELFASHTITVRALSADSSSNTQTFSIAIADVDEFDVSAISDADGAANSVAENAGIGSAVRITAFATDPDATTNAITYSLLDNAGGRFAIDATSGVVTVAGALNYESLTSHDIVVRALSADGSSKTGAFTISVTDVDEFNVGAISDTDTADNIVAEDAGIGSVVHITAVASDADATTNTITYSLLDNAGGRFAVHATSGVVTVAGVLDYESATSHAIVVRATSADGSSNDQSFTITLTDADEFNVGAISDSDTADNIVAEDAGIGSLVGVTAFATDPDATTNSITYSLLDNAGGLFTIDAASGAVRVAGALNYETATSHGIVVRALSADGSSITGAFTISVTDVDEFNVGAISDSDTADDSVAEDAGIGSVVGITALATDPDATTNAISYSLLDNAGGRFAIDATSGVVTVAGALNYETLTSHGIVVRATSADGSSITEAFTISVTDVDEFNVGAISDTDAVANIVSEDVGIGSAVHITAFASDADATTNTITYSLLDDAGGRFAIHATSGVVRVAGVLDYESATSHAIVVRATSADGSSSDQGFTITLTDADEFDVDAIDDTDTAGNSVAENATVGTLVGITAFASDADATTNTITYSLLNDAGGRFAVDATSGVVTVAGGFNYETATSHSIVVQATSVDGSSITEAFTISVTDVDEFNVGAISDSDTADDSVAEDAGIGSVVGITAFATDPDATDNTITYTLDNNAGGRFAIDASNGVVTVAAALDAETAPSHSITVRATSSDGSFSTQLFSIAVDDVDEFAVGPISDSNAAPNAVDENVVAGTVVGLTASALDGDATNNSVTYTLTDDAGGLFAIDSVTGVVSVAGALDAELATAYTITVEATSIDGSVVSEDFVIALNDIDEFDVGPISDIDVLADEVYEDAGVGATVGLVAYATDDDATTYDITYTLDNDDGGRFAIDAISGEVTVAGVLDYESATSHGIVVRATSADGSYRLQAFTIGVLDADEVGVGAVSDNDAAADSVAENAGIGSAVGISAFASDADATNNTITYFLDDDAAGRFAIDASSGVVTVAGALDYENATSHSIVVRATSTDGSSSTQGFTISLSDVSEFGVGAITDIDATSNSVAENATLGALVGINASASDADATGNTITYSLDDDAGGRFAINAGSGVVTVVGALDRESAASHGIVVRATSADGSFSTQSFTIALADVNEFGVGPIGDTNIAANSVAEDASPGTVAGITARASDTDATNNTIAYSLDFDAGGRFSIDGNTGVVTVAGALDAETAASHNLVVRATSADGSFTTQTLTIWVADVNDAPVINNQIFGGAENSANGSVLGSILSSDQDAPDTASYTITAGNLGGAFTIDASGQLLVANGAALDFETTPSFSLTVEVRDAGGLTDIATVTVNLSGVNEGPVLTSNTLTVTQGGSVTLSRASTAASDVDTPTGLLVFTVSNVTNGHFEMAGVPGAPVTMFTQADIDAGQVRFVHGGGDIAPAYDLSVSDGTWSVGPLASSISLGSAPSAPVLPPPVIWVPPNVPDVSEDSAPVVAESPVVADEPAVADNASVAVDAPAGAIQAVLPTVWAELPQAQLNEYEVHPIKPARVNLPVATLNDLTPAPEIVLTFESLAPMPTKLDYVPTTPVDWSVRPAFTEEGEETPREGLEVLLDQVKVGGMALSVGVVWWASRISGLVGTLLASTPAWRHIDPLPVVAGDEDEEKTWYDPDDRDADANELAIADVLEGARAAGNHEQA